MFLEWHKLFHNGLLCKKMKKFVQDTIVHDLHHPREQLRILCPQCTAGEWQFVLTIPDHKTSSWFLRQIASAELMICKFLIIHACCETYLSNLVWNAGFCLLIKKLMTLQAFGQIAYKHNGKYYLNKWVYNNQGELLLVIWIRNRLFWSGITAESALQPSETHLITLCNIFT